MSKMLYVGLVELDVFSGLSIFQPLASTSAPTYPLPPPTTLLGALAYPYLRRHSLEDINNYSATVKLLDYIKYAAAGAEGYVITREAERVFQVIYQRKDRWSEEYRDLWYTIGIRGVVKYLDDKLLVLYVSNDPRILEYSYGITRIGRKESHVSVRKVVVKPLEDVLVAEEPKVFKTFFYAPVGAVTECESSIRIRMPRLTRSNYTYSLAPETEEYYVPREFGPMSCRTSEEGVLISINDYEIALPKSVISYG